MMGKSHQHRTNRSRRKMQKNLYTIKNYVFSGEFEAFLTVY